MHAFRFLSADGWDPIAGVRWSTAWAEPAGGVIAYPVEALHHWVAPTLWRVEIDGNVTARELSVRADRGRLVAPVEAWDEHAGHDFARSCRERHADVANNEGSSAIEVACVAGYVAARLAGVAAVDGGSSYTDGESEERELQIAWVRRRAALDEPSAREL